VNEVASIIKSIGLFQTKARYIVETSKILVNDFQSKVPSSKEELVSFPGVGNKTANVVRAELFKIPEIAVDTHVSRISVRLKLALPTDSVKQIEEKLRNQIDVSRYIKTHHQMIHFGRYFCTARKPLCFKCKLVNQCGEKKKILLEK
jgi:endonuclease-3